MSARRRRCFLASAPFAIKEEAARGTPAERLLAGDCARSEMTSTAGWDPMAAPAVGVPPRRRCATDCFAALGAAARYYSVLLAPRRCSRVWGLLCVGSWQWAGPAKGGGVTRGVSPGSEVRAMMTPESVVVRHASWSFASAHVRCIASPGRFCEDLQMGCAPSFDVISHNLADSCGYKYKTTQREERTETQTRPHDFWRASRLAAHSVHTGRSHTP